MLGVYCVQVVSWSHPLTGWEGSVLDRLVSQSWKGWQKSVLKSLALASISTFKDHLHTVHYSYRDAQSLSRALESTSSSDTEDDNVQTQGNW